MILNHILSNVALDSSTVDVFDIYGKCHIVLYCVQHAVEIITNDFGTLFYLLHWTKNNQQIQFVFGDSDNLQIAWNQSLHFLHS